MAVAGLLGAFAPGGTAVADRGLTVSPTRIVVPAGQLGHDAEVEVINDSSHPMEVMVQTQDMQADQSGAMRLVKEAPYSAMGWVTTTPDRFQLAAQERRRISVRVAVPKGAEPGDHHVGLVFVSPGTGQGGGVRINQGVGIPVYVEVPGPVDRSVALTDFEAPKFALWGPVTFTASMRHTGTVHRDFRGDERLKLMVGDRVVAVPEFTVLRDAARDVVVRWDSAPFMCVCRATLAVPNADGSLQRKSATVVIFPVPLFVGAVVLILGALIFYRRSRRSSLRDWLRSRREQHR